MFLDSAVGEEGERGWLRGSGFTFSGDNFCAHLHHDTSVGHMGAHTERQDLVSSARRNNPKERTVAKLKKLIKKSTTPQNNLFRHFLNKLFQLFVRDDVLFPNLARFV